MEFQEDIVALFFPQSFLFPNGSW